MYIQKKNNDMNRQKAEEKGTGRRQRNGHVNLIITACGFAIKYNQIIFFFHYLFINHFLLHDSSSFQH